MSGKRKYAAADFIRQLIFAWLFAALWEYLLLSAGLRDLSGLDGLANMSFGRVLTVTAVFWLLLRLVFGIRNFARIERWGSVAAFCLLAILSLITSFTVAFLGFCILVAVILTVYALFGWNHSSEVKLAETNADPTYLGLTVGISVLFFLFVSVWTVARVGSMSVPSYDFGIFSQMFYYMKETGLPLTTLERDGLLSHFDVHMSPIYYLMLPFYCIVPTPATLQVLQAAVITSAVIPLWLIGKRHGLSGLQRTLLCALLLLYPAFSGGTGYDIHENCFLTPLILWLLYGIDKKSIPITAIAAALTAMVKEDAAAYVGIVAVYLIVRSILRRKKGEWWGTITGACLLVCALGYFFAVTGHLAKNGDGVMTYRYDNFIYDGSGSLVTVIKAVIMNPMKALFECVDKEKLQFIAQTMLPLLGLPLLTRRFERYILLIPYVLINLMSDYQYQHDIFFQYTFGSTAFLIYLVAVNLADLRISLVRVAALGTAAVISFGCFAVLNVPLARRYVEYCNTYSAYYEEVRDVLDTIPDDASVTATTFYTTHLSQRKVLYDVQYCSKEHLLSTEFVALNIKSDSTYKRYGGFENLIKLLEDNGYTLYAQREGTLVIYQRPK